MEHLKSYYTLEKHLEESSLVNNQFEILNAIWKLNKRNLSSALSNISQYYPHYSLHERSHSKTIISNIESFLGEERIKKLSPTNTWLILMSAYTHDLGMVVFQDLIQQEWLSDNFQDFLKETSESENVELKMDAKILLRIQNIKKNPDDEILSDDLTPIRIKNAVITIVAEYIRRIHHERSSDIIKGADRQFYEIANAFYSEQIPKRLLNILGEIAFLHGVEFYEIFKRLEFESNGISSDKINPRLIACLLRLGDLLDVDDSRFNNFTQKVFIYPESSKSHVEKHASIKHILITPEAIEITSDCSSENVYRLARSWFDWLEEEVEKQSKEWSNIAPIDLGGSSPTIPKGKIKVYYQNQEVDDKLLNLRFEVSNQKIFEILEGASIYDKAELTFVRELVQNALDASKIQLWKEIEKGTFDFAFKTHFDLKTLTHEEIIEKIQFPNDIPQTLYDSFEVNLNINWTDSNQDVLKFEVIDNGTGISDSDLIRMANRVGESRKKDKDFQKFLSRMPFWLKPTGAFGIGLQSVFIITDSFKLISKAEGQQTKEIIFRSSKKGKYSSVAVAKNEINRGTKVIVEIPKKRFNDIFGTTFSWDIISNYDYFTDKHDSIYVPKMKFYIDQVLSKISKLKINFFGDILQYNTKESSDFTLVESSLDGSFLIQSLLLVKQQEIYFDFYEKIIGSEFLLYFFPNFINDINEKWPAQRTEYLVREIPVESNTINYHRLNFSKLYWNFMSPESDKILSLTREKFISKRKRELESQFINEVIPQAILQMEGLFTKNYEKLKNEHKISEESLAVTYFKILLTKKINNIQANKINDKIFSNKYLPKELAEDFSGNEVLMSDFFNFDNIVVPIFAESQFRNELSLIEGNKVDIINKLSGLNKDKVLLIKHNSFFQIYLIYNYKISEIYYLEKKQILLLKKNHDNPIVIKEGREKYLKSILRSNGLLGRGNSYAIDEYYDSLAIANIHASGFEHFPYLSNQAILSPFKSYNDYKSFKESFKTDDYKNTLTIEKVKSIITLKLVKWIIENKPEKIEIRTEEKIYEGYKNLIIELLESDL